VYYLNVTFANPYHQELGQRIPCPSSCAVAFEQSIFMQGFDVVFNGIPADVGRVLSITNGYSAMLSCNFQNLHGQFRQITQNKAFTPDFGFKFLFLPAKGC